MIVVTYLLRQSITLYKNLGGLEQNLGGLEPLSPIASAATAYNISWCCQNLSSLLLKVSVVSADITVSGKLFHTFTILGTCKRKFP